MGVSNKCVLTKICVQRTKEDNSIQKNIFSIRAVEEMRGDNSSFSRNNMG